MPDKIAQRVARLQNDFKKMAPNKITGVEADGLIRRVKRDGLTESEYAAIKVQVAQYATQMTPEAKLKLDTFIGGARPSVRLDVRHHQPGSIKDPLVLKGDTKKVEQEFITGAKLFENGVKSSDPRQNYIGDCYLMAAMSSVAAMNPAVIQKAFKDNHDGTFTVHLFDRKGGKLVRHDVKIDADLPRSGTYGYVYAQGKSPKELWPALLEKAFAARVGSYRKIEGGVPALALEQITGKASTDMVMKGEGVTPDSIFAAITANLKKNKPMTAATAGDSSAAKYTNTGIYTDHTYSILGTSVDGGTKYIKLRNPWGNSEPSGNGADDGVFKLPLAQFVALFPDVAVNG